MTSDPYSLIFDVEKFSTHVEDRLLDDGFGINVQQGLWSVDLLVPGSDAVEVAKDVSEGLQCRGVTVWRLRLELVNMSMIATRTGVSRTAVGKWAREIQSPGGLPSPFTLTDQGPLWAWADVNEWLRNRGGDRCEAWRTPTAIDVEEFNCWLRRTRAIKDNCLVGASQV